MYCVAKFVHTKPCDQIVALIELKEQITEPIMDDQNKKEMKMRNSLVQNTKQIKLKKNKQGEKLF